MQNNTTINNNLSGNRKILLLVTHDEYFSRSLLNNNSPSMKIDVLHELFQAEGFQTKILHFEDVYDANIYRDWIVLFASYEDKGLFYKDYIEDILLRLEYAGAVLIPSFKYFRCHHNKVFMEGLRTDLCNESLKTIKSFIYGSYRSYIISKNKDIAFPVVLKPSAGAGSQGVSIACNIKELNKIIKNICIHIYAESISYRLLYLIKIIFNFFLRKPIIAFRYENTHKFIIQNYIEGLDGDYKVLVFYDKYYILKRNNRSNDFRASGSGEFVFPTDIKQIRHILDFAKNAHDTFNTPISSLDIGYDGDKCHLIEFQFIDIGPYTLQHSTCYYVLNKVDEWHKVDEKSDLEKEYVRAIVNYIKES